MVRKEKIVEIYGNYSLYIIKENYGLRMGEHKPCCILSIHEENEENSFHEIFIDFVRWMLFNISLSPNINLKKMFFKHKKKMFKRKTDSILFLLFFFNWIGKEETKGKFLWFRTGYFG